MTAAIEVRPTDRRFIVSPPEGEPDCICSRCGAGIPEEGFALRLFVDNGRGGEYRYCDWCQERMGIWSHLHYPAIAQRAHGPSVREINVCGECRQRIIRAGGAWKLAPPFAVPVRGVNLYSACAEGEQR